MSGRGTSIGNNTDPVAAVHEACTTYALDTSGAYLLHHYSNAVVLLPREDAIARVTTGHHSVAQIRRSLTVARWLVDSQHFPATAPLPHTDVIRVDPNTTVSFWAYYPQPETSASPTSAHVGRLLAHLHATVDPPADLPQWLPLSSLEQALHDDAAAMLRDGDRGWLLRRIHEMRDELASLHWSLGHGLIHGDAWAGNLLWSSSTPGADDVVLGDWDRVAHGPREIDLVPTWHAARRYGKGPNWTAQFIDQYGHDLADWPGLPTLLAMRDLVQVSGPLRRAPHSAPHARALQQRVDSLRAGDTSTIWAAL